MNLRVLTKKGVPTPLAAATVALTQVTTVVVTVISLVTVAVITGSTQLTDFQVTPLMLIIIGIIAAAVGVIFSVPKSRTWVIARVEPMFKQTWPRFVELLSSPIRLGLGILGNLLAMAAYVTSMYWSVLAFGQSVPFFAVAVVYLLGNSAGAFIQPRAAWAPSKSQNQGRSSAIGINAGVAASIVLLFRFVTFWIRIPLGWVAYRYARKIGEV